MVALARQHGKILYFPLGETPRAERIVSMGYRITIDKRPGHLFVNVLGSNTAESITRKSLLAPDAEAVVRAGAPLDARSARPFA